MREAATSTLGVLFFPHSYALPQGRDKRIYFGLVGIPNQNGRFDDA